MIGREQELSAVRAQLARTGGDRATVVVVEGAVGVGKSVFLAAVAEQASADGLQILTTTGVPGGQPDFGNLHQLLHPLLGDLGSVPRRQADALASVLGLGEAVERNDLFVSLATLALIENAARAAPVVVVVDGFEHVDTPTRQVLEFFARHPAAGDLALVVGLRESGRGTEVLHGVERTRVVLAGLTRQQARALVDEAYPRLSARGRQRVLEEARGNPLALHEFARASWLLESTGGEPREQPPATRRLESALLGEVDDLTRGARQMLLLAAAAAPGTPLAELLAAGADLGVTPAAIDELERHGLADPTGGSLRPADPLLLSVTYGGATTAERQAVHQALSAVSADPFRAVWHRAAAVSWVDEALAGELEAAAVTADARGARREATAAFARAARLSDDVDAKVRRLSFGAESARRGGFPEDGFALLQEALALAHRPDDVARLALTEIMLGISYGTPARSTEDVTAVARRLGAAPTEHAGALSATVLAGAAARIWWRGHPPDEVALVREALGALDGRGGWMVDLAQGMLDPIGVAGQLKPRFAEILDSAIESALHEPMGPSGSSTTRWLNALARAAESRHDLAAAERAWDVQVRQHRATGAVGDEIVALCGRAQSRLLAGDLALSWADAAAAVSLAVERRFGVLARAAASVAGLAAVLLGDEGGLDEMRRVGQAQAGADVSVFVLAYEEWAAGLAALLADDERRAWEHLRRVTRHPSTTRWAVADIAEAGARSGHRDEAADVVAKVAEDASSVASASLDARVARACALLTDEDLQDDAFDRAVERGIAAGSGLELARTRLAYGEALRRRRQVVVPREQLRAAVSGLEASGAEALAVCARAALRAVGVVPARAVVDPAAVLSERELVVARLAAQGMSNKEIASVLVVSPRTVAAHLHRAFPKLGITGRGQLAGLPLT
ncbi:LuxR family transcriptional regulator [Luteimicrobium xylanilyticum]|uniref:Non-specific serine/threonine protein kinase n=1 Tax=Luteimicrobium xylanilyticum TaxID=1133546 RepID=A0A5P9QDU8_9MICO|nr:helix-turn-helix transcriptional regulator [Luteimicrobium xylanilyticum]QFU99230.1 Non-specific serine/threonine protein kinase [Luteimicrobium xylanilyticum]